MTINFIDRLNEEHLELSVKVNKLESFIHAGKPSDLSQEHFLMLKYQLQYMKGYLNVLADRLELLK